MLSFYLIIGGSIQEAAISAKNGSNLTKTMESLAGRSNYILKEQMDGTPDPGSLAVAIAFEVAAKLLIE